MNIRHCNFCFHSEYPIWFFATLLLAANPLTARSQEAVWGTFKRLFVTGEGRVIDNVNNNVSHSESQGYGLVLAEANNDQATFRRIWDWTEQNLRKRNDHLFAWRWENNSSNDHVPDTNNATDGDLLISWGLARGGSAWGDPGLQGLARDIARDVRQEMLRPSNYGPILLPGEHGFETTAGVVVNLSYWIFPAFRELAKIDPSPDWQLLEQSGLKLVQAARFSPWKLPPDWLLLTQSSEKVAEGFEPVYGYNAVRVPLYLAWAGIKPAVYYASFRRLALFSLYSNSRPPPAKVSLPSGIPVDVASTKNVEPALPGMIAIYELISGIGDLRPSRLQAPYAGTLPDESYYSVSLGLLSNCAAIEASAINP
jgi:endoglucanase